MLDWSLVSEYLALLIDAILIYYFHDRRQAATSRRGLYWGCLISAVAASVLDVACTWVGTVARHLPHVFIELMNYLYFVAVSAMTLFIALYLLARLYSYVGDKRGLKASFAILLAIGAGSLASLFVNARTGWLFFIDRSGAYVQGPWNSLTYLIAAFEAALLLVNYKVHAKSVSRAASKVVYGVPVLVIPLVGFQMMFPGQLLSGMFGAIVNLVIYLNFQSCRVDIDPLTELGNRNSLMNELSHRIGSGEQGQFILIALRGFSQVNQVYGHLGGDAVLFHIARRLERLASGGLAYRFGGDEFVVMLPDGKGSEQDARLYEVVSAMRASWPVAGHQVKVPATIVELRSAERGWTPEDIVNRLEFSLAVARREGLEMLRFDSDVARRYLRQQELDASVRRAAEDGRFEVWYQPIYCADTDSFAAAEALLRMRDEKGGLVSPAEFIPLAEGCDLIDDLTWIVVHAACDLLQSGKAPELRSISVNLTARQLLQNGFCDRFCGLVEEHGVDPSQIKLEITERMVAENGALVHSVMDEMRSRGVEFMMDDFGTGYSNLSSALNMPFSYTKLDKSLIDKLTVDQNSRLMVSTLVPFFHKLGQVVVAEGIETGRQASIALEYGVDRIQGFYYAKPMPVRELIRWYRVRQ